MRPQVIVVNKYGKPVDAYTVVYIGRPTALGNPFPVKEHGRERSVELYREYLRKEWKTASVVRKELEELADRVYHGECIALECYCKPKACHGDILKEAIEGINRRRTT